MANLHSRVVSGAKSRAHWLVGESPGLPAAVILCVSSLLGAATEPI